MGIRDDMNIISATSEEEFHKKYESFKQDKIRIKQLDFNVTILPSGQPLFSVLIVTGM